MKSRLLSFILFVIGMGIFLSCADEQNFNQFDDLSIEPTIASSIFYFESDEEFINSTGSGVFYTQSFTFQAFSEAFVSDNILDGTIIYQVENTTSKGLNILVEFLDESGAILDSELFIIAPEPSPLLERQIAYGNGDKDLDILRNTASIRVSGENLGDANSISPIAAPKIILRSSAEFRLKLR